MKIKIAFLLFIFSMQILDAVFDEQVNGKLKECVDQSVINGRQIEKSDINQMLKIYEKLRNNIATHSVDSLWDDQKTRDLVRIIIQEAHQDKDYQSLHQEAIQKTIEMQQSWNKTNKALYSVMAKTLSAKSTIQFPHYDNSTFSLDEYMKKLFELNNAISDENYDAVAAGTIALFKTLQDQRNALKNANPDLF